MVATNSTVLERLLSPIAECLTPESAERLVRLQVAPEAKSRIDELARKANDGNLSESEQFEYREYVEIMDFIGILQAKARQIIARPISS